MNEAAFIDALRVIAGDPAARGLMDDAAVIEFGEARLVVTHDMIVEGVHYLPDDPPGDVAWKLLTVNLSDLAGKGARPAGVLLGYMLGDEAWDAAFVKGLAAALSAFSLPLLGGDTVKAPPGTPRTLGLTAFGHAAETVPWRGGAAAGDHLWVSGTIGDAGAGLAALRSGRSADALIERYRTPRPRLEAGRRLAPLVSAMMDISDGLLIDAARMAGASGCSIRIELDAIPLSEPFLAAMGDTRGARLEAATGGDDYELLFTAPPSASTDILALSDALGLPFSRIGACGAGAGLSLTESGGAVPLPARLGFEHG